MIVFLVSTQEKHQKKSTFFLVVWFGVHNHEPGGTRHPLQVRPLVRYATTHKHRCTFGNRKDSSRKDRPCNKPTKNKHSESAAIRLGRWLRLHWFTGFLHCTRSKSDLNSPGPEDSRNDFTNCDSSNHPSARTTAHLRNSSNENFRFSYRPAASWT